MLFTLGLLAVYRVGGHIPTPGINPEALAALVDQAKNTMFGLYDMFSGKNLSQMTIFALGIMPYISSSIILQLLTVVWPYLERLSKEGELGRRKITQYTRYGTILLSVVQALGIALFPREEHRDRRRPAARLQPGLGLPADDGADADDRHGFIMWLGEQITERGIGNGMSLIIFAGHRRRACRAPCSRRSNSCGPARWAWSGCSLLIVLMVAGRRRHRLRRARPPAGHGAVRQAGRRPPHVRRLEHAHPAEGEHRRRHPGHFRLVDPGVSGNAYAARSGRAAFRLVEAPIRADRARHAAARPAVRRRHHLLLLFLHRDHLQPG